MYANKLENTEIKFPAVDNIRLFSILGIVCLHSFMLFYVIDKDKLNYPTWIQLLYCGFIQIGRFGNICFFMVSGLLFGAKTRRDNFNKLKAKEYVNKRINTLFKPTLLFLGLSVCYHILLYQLKHVLNTNVTLNEILNAMLASEWFIFTLFLGLYLLKYFGQSKWFLLLLFMFAFVLGLDAYVQWFPFISNHQGFLGFIFYLFLGYHMGINVDYYQKWIIWIRANIKVYSLILFIVFIITVFDNLFLYKIASLLPFNSLKLSNQVYSVLIFGLMSVVFEKPVLPKIINPRIETVGIYFIHQIVLFGDNFLKKLVFGVLDISGRESLSMKFLFPVALINFILIYLVSLFIVKLIAKTKYASWVGIPTPIKSKALEVQIFS